MTAGRLSSRVLAYIRYLAKANNRHGVHSPFVYKLLTDCIYREDTTDPGIKELRRSLLNDHSEIRMQDHGAGSRSSQPSLHYGGQAGEYLVKTSRIARRALKAPKYAGLLARLVNHFKPGSFIELGTSLGVTTATIAAANPGTEIITIEGSPELYKKAAGHFSRLGLNNIDARCGTFEELLPGLLQQKGKAGMVYIDGNHRKAPTLRYFDLLMAHSTPDTILIFDDINWSPEMQEAWQEICSHPAVTLTIDLFELGLVFFTTGRQEKEHFMIRY